MEKEQAIQQFRDALERLATKTDTFMEDVLGALLARDWVACSLKTAPPEPGELQELVSLDGQLKEKTRVIANRLLSEQLGQWRAARLPDSTAWWWFLDNLSVPSPLWTAVAAFLFTASMTLFISNSAKLMTPDTDLGAAAAVFTQGLLALLTSATFTSAGQNWMSDLLARFGVSVRYRNIWMTLLALVTFLVTLTITLSLASVAKVYWTTADGMYAALKSQGRGDIDLAIKTYRRALALDPDLAQARYNLATIYEDLGDKDSAIREYRLAITSDPKLLSAYNNLARLYILQGKDFPSALKLLNEGIDRRPQDQGLRYALLKNRGWAELKIELYTLAQHDLEAAIQMDPKKASAHYLLSVVYKAENNLSSADRERAASLNCPDAKKNLEPDWYAALQQFKLSEEPQ